jgi:prophage antirepressor-like protein
MPTLTRQEVQALREVKAKWTVKRLRKGADQEGLRLLRRATNGDISDVTRRGFTTSEKRSLQSFVDGTSEIFRKILEVEAEECPHNINPHPSDVPPACANGGSEPEPPTVQEESQASQSDVNPAEGSSIVLFFEDFSSQRHPVRIIRNENFATSLYRVDDFCDIIGLSSASAACRRLDQDEVVVRMESHPASTRLNSTSSTNASTGAHRVLYVTGPGLFRLINSARIRTPLVVAVQRWVCHEVIPAIMDTGRYEVPNQTPTSIVLAPQQLTQLVEQLAGPVAQIAADRLSESFFARTLQLAESLKDSDETLAGLLAISVESHMRTEEFMAKAAQEMREGVETIQRAAQSCEGIYGMLDSLKGEIDSLASNKRHLIDSLGRQITRLENI